MRSKILRSPRSFAKLTACPRAHENIANDQSLAVQEKFEETFKELHSMRRRRNDVSSLAH